MPIDPSMLAKSIGTLTDLDPTSDPAATLQQAVQAAKSLFDADAAGIMLADLDGQLRWASASDQRAPTLEDNQEVFAAGPCMEAFVTGRPSVLHDATLERRWGEITLVFVEVQIRSALSVPVELGGGPIGTLDVYAAEPRGWDDSEVTALEAYGGVVASLLGAAAKAQVKGALADHLQLTEEELLETWEAAQSQIGLSLDRPVGDDADVSMGDLVAAPGPREEAEDLLALAGLIADLPELERQTIVLRYFQDLHQDAIAARLGYSQMHVSRLLRRALARLRAQLVEP